MTFTQRDLKLNRKQFLIEKDGLRVVAKSISGRTEDYYDFEDIGDKITHQKKRLLIPLFISMMLFGYGTIILIGTLNGGKYGDYAVHFYYITGLVFFCVFYFFGKNNLYLSHKRNVSHIHFINNNPSKKKQEKFIQELLEEKRRCLLERYAEYDEDKSYEEHRHQLRWLKDNEYLTKDEYRDRLSGIEAKFQTPNLKGTEGIGFRKNNG
jgi:hypothetical protein